MGKTSKLRQQLTILAWMYLGYGGMMICRQTVIILSPAMLEDPSLSLTKASFGAVLGWGTAGALVGKLVWGPLSDLLGGRRTFLLGLSITGVLVAMFGWMPEVLFAVLSFMIYGTKSAGWPAMAKLIENWYHPQKYGRVWGVLSTSSRASVVGGTLLLGGLLSVLSWRWVAVVAGVLALLIFVGCFIFLKEKPPQSFLRDDTEKSADREKAAETAKALQNKLQHPLRKKTLGQALAVFGSSKRVWLICLSLMALTVLMEFLSFVPIYLKENFNISASRAATASSVFPVGSLIAVLVGGYYYDKLSRRRLRYVIGGLLSLAVLCLLGLMYLPLSGSTAFPVTLSLILLFGMAISPAYYLPMSIFSIEFGGIHSGVLICLIDAMGFLAAMVFNFRGGAIADGPGGWHAFMTLLLVIAVLAVVLMLAFLNEEYKVARKKNE